jgi:hypothetical protein
VLITQKILNQIRPNLDLMRLSPDALVARAVAVKTGVPTNPAYSNSPVDPETLGSVINAYIVANAEGLDSKKARAQRDKLHGDLVRLLRKIGHYVEAQCNDDLPTLLSSGFEPQPPRAASVAQPLPAAAIQSLEQGNSGQLIVSIKALPKARSYELQYAPVNGGAPITLTLHAAKPAPVIEGLTPGTNYSFRVRAFGKAGFTDWSDPATRICI